MSDKIDIDDWDDLDNWDDGDIDFDSPADDPKSRVAKTAITVGKTIGDEIYGEGNLKRHILDSLPDDYSTAYSAYDGIVGAGKGIYDTAREEAREINVALKRATKSVLPLVESTLPKGIADKIKEWSDEHQYVGSKFDPDAAEMEAGLSKIFGAEPAGNGRPPEEADKKTFLEERAKEEIKDNARDKMSRNSVQLLEIIAKNSDRDFSFSTGPTIDFRRKLIELNYRQAFSLTALVKSTQAGYESIIPALNDIRKNTALPDYAKELPMEVVKAKAMRTLIDAVSPMQHLQGTFNDIGKNAAEKMKIVGRTARDFISGADDGAKIVKEFAGEGIDVKEMAAEEATAEATRTVLEWLVGDKIRAGKAKLKEWTESKPGAAKTGRRAANFLGNLPRQINDIANNPFQDFDPDEPSSAIKVLVGLMAGRGYRGPQAEDKHIENLDAVAPNTVRVNRAITDIIPGVLFKIDQSIRSIGATTPQPLETWDDNKRSFVTTDEVTRDIRTYLHDAEGRARTERVLDQGVNDIIGDGEASDEERAALRNMLESKGRGAGSVSIDDLLKDDHLAGNLESLLLRFMEDEDPSIVQKRILTATNNVGYATRSLQSRVNEAKKLYGEQAFANAGLYTYDKERAGFGTRGYLDDSVFSSKATLDLDKLPSQMVQPRAGINSNIVNNTTVKNDKTSNLNVDDQGIRESIADGFRSLMDPENENSLASHLKALRVAPTEKADAVQSPDMLESIYQQLEKNHNNPILDRIEKAVSTLTVNHYTVNADKLPKGAWGAVKTLGGSAWGLGGKIFRGGVNNAKKNWRRSRRVTGWVGRKVGGLVPGVLKTAWSLTAGTVRAAASTVEGFARGLNGPADIYDSTKKLVFSAKLLKKGYYRNAKGKVIESIDDLDGEVYDASGNVIYSKERVAEILKDLHAWKDGKMVKLGSFTSRMGGKIGRGLGKGFGGLISLPGKVISAAVKTVKAVAAHADIYVQGETIPRLTRYGLMSGLYASGVTGKIIRKVRDIDGPVVLAKDPTRFIITEAEIKDPSFVLVDRWGKRFVTIGDYLAKAGRIALSVIKLPFKAVGRGLKLAKDLVGAGGDWLKAGVEGMSGAVGGVSKRLDKIYDLLDKRLGQGKRPVKGDKDGDGVRDNSFMDIFRRRRAAREKEDDARKLARKNKKDKNTEKKATGFLGKIIGGMAGLIGSGIGKIATFAATTFIGTVLSGLATGIKTIFMSGLSMLGQGLKTILAGAGRLAWGATTGLASGLWKGAVWTARTAIPHVARAAITAVGVTVGAIASSAMAVAAIAGGVGYYLYRQTIKPKPLDAYRFLQYGLEDYTEEESDDLAKVRYLEDYLLKFMSYDDRGVATLRGINEKECGEMMKHFGWLHEGDENASDAIYGTAWMGFGRTNAEKIEIFMEWFHARFIQIYLLWASRARQHAPDVAFKDIGDKTKLNARTILKIAHTCTLSPRHELFKVALGPFDNEELITSPGTIDEAARKLIGLMENDAKDAKDETSKTADVNPETGAKRTFEIIDDGKTWWKADVSEAEQRKDGSVKVRGALFRSMEHYETTRLEQIEEEKLYADSDAFRITETGGKEEKDMGRGVQNVNAIDAIRLKAYGLETLDQVKVKTLFRLEERYFAAMVRSGNGYLFKGDIGKLFNQSKADFGIAEDNALARTNWLYWMKHRFAPVLTTYVQHLYAHAPAAHPFSVVISGNSPYLLEVAQAVRSATNADGVSIWKQNVSPWKGYVLNESPSSTEPNLEFLQNMMLNKEANQQVGDPNKRTLKIVGELGGKRYGDNAKQMQEDTKREVSVADDDKPWLNGYTPGGNDGPSSIDYTKDGVSIGSPMMEGAGGLYLEVPRGDGSKESLANIIKHAAKMVGIDPNLLLAVGQVESSLDPKAGAGTSTAKGLFQFLNDTWTEMLGKYGNKYGLPKNASRYDPVANSIMGALYVRDGMKTVQKAVKGRQVNATDMYLAHFMGPTGAKDFLTELARNPNGDACRRFPTQSRSNRPIFRDERGRARSFAQVYQELQRRMGASSRHIQQYMHASESELVGPKANVVVPEHLENVNSVKERTESAKAQGQTTAISAPPASIARPVSSEQVAKETTAASETTEVIDTYDVEAIGNYRKEAMRQEYTDTRNDGLRREAKATAAASASIESMSNVKAVLEASLAEQRTSNAILLRLEKLLASKESKGAPTSSTRSPAPSFSHESESKINL